MAESINYEYILNMFFGSATRARVAAQSILGKTRYGQGNLISIVDDSSGGFKFKVSATGEVVESLNQARDIVDSYFLTEFFSLGTEARHGDALGFLSEIMGSVRRKSGMFTAEQQRILRATGISQDVINEIMSGSFTSSLATFRVSENQRAQGSYQSAMARKLAELTDSGEMVGSLMFDDEGARMIQMETAGGTKLNQLQIQTLFRLAGHGTISAEEVFGQTGSLQAGRVLKDLAKVPKRQRAYLSPRDISLSGALLDDILGGRKLDDSVFVFSENLYLFAKHFGMEDQALRSGILKDVGVKLLKDKQINTNSFFTSFINLLTDEEKEVFKYIGKKGKQTNRANRYIRNVVQGAFRDLESDAMNGVTITGEMLKSAISSRIESGTYSQEQKDLMQKYIESMFDSNTKAFDGFSVFSSGFYGDIAESLKGQIATLESQIGSNTLSAEEKLNAQVRLRDLKNQLTAVGYALEANPEQHTIRANIGYGGRRFDVKSSTIPTQLDPILLNEGYIAMVSEADLKTEITTAGDVSGINISGLGRSRGVTYLDETTGAFIGRYIQGEDYEDFVRGNLRRITDEVSEFNNTGRISQQLLDAIKHEANQNIAILPEHMRDAARRNREYASRLLEMYRSGIDVRSAPSLVNFVHQYMAREAFRVKNGVSQIALPGTTRLSALSEAAIDIAAAGGFQSFTQGGMSSRSSIRFDDGEVANDIVNFRIKGHGLLFASQDVQTLHHVLGGFDLDDKALIHYASYVKDNGMKSFGFLVSRQPSGIEEVMFGRAILDQHSVYSTFGKRKDIMDNIVSLMNQSTPDSRKAMLQSLAGGNISYTDEQANEIFKAIEELFFLRKNNVTGKYSVRTNIDSMLTDTLLYPSSPRRVQATQKKMMELLTGDQATVGEHIENLLATMYGGPTLSQDARSLIAAGGKYLSVDKMNYKDPTFASFLVKRQLFSAGSGDLTDPMLGALSSFEDGEIATIHSRLLGVAEAARSAGLQSDQVFEAVQRSYNSEYEAASSAARTMMEVALDNAFSIQTAKDAEQFGEILGVYVNRSMIVGNVLGQIEELAAGSVSNQDFYDFLNRDSFKMLYAGQEEAIDAAVLMGRVSRESVSAITDALDRGASNESVLRSMQMLWDELGFNPSSVVEGLGTDARGELMIRQMGRLLGASMAMSEEGMGIDVGLLLKSSSGKSRLSDTDLSIAMAEMQEGLRLFEGEYSQKTGYESQVNRAREMLAKLEEITNIGSTEEGANILALQRERFIEEFGLREGRHAAVYSNRKLAESVARQFISQRTSISDISLSYVSSSAEAERVAQQIMEDHKNLLDRIERSSRGVADEAIDQISREARKLGLAENLFQSVLYAADTHGLDLQELANELDRAGFSFGIDILDIPTVATDDPTDRVSGLVSFLEKNRRLRQLRVAAQSQDTSLLEDILNRAVQYKSMDALEIGQSAPGQLIAYPRGKQPKDYPLGERVMTIEEATTEAGRTSDENLQEYVRAMLRDYDDYSEAGTLAQRGRAESRKIKAQKKFFSKMQKRLGDSGFEEAIGLLRAYIEEGPSTQEQRAVANAYRALNSLATAEAEGLPDIPDPVSGSNNAGITRAVRRSIDDAVQGVSEASRIASNYKSFREKLEAGDFRQLFENKLLRKTAVGIGALVAGSFLYEGFRDRTEQDLQGPPMLPGGSAYEDYPVRNPQLPDISPSYGRSGMSYDVSVNGSQDQVRRFNERAAALTNGNTSTTIYNNLPRSRRDPYSEMGQRY